VALNTTGENIENMALQSAKMAKIENEMAAISNKASSRR